MLRISHVSLTGNLLSLCIPVSLWFNPVYFGVVGLGGTE